MRNNIQPAIAIVMVIYIIQCIIRFQILSVIAPQINEYSVPSPQFLCVILTDLENMLDL